MKKTISTFLVIALLLSLAAVLAGCGSEQDLLIGNWKTSVNFADMINQSLSGAGEMAEYLSVEDFTVTMVMTFREDGTYAVSIDEASMTAAFNGYLDSLKSGIVKMLEAQIAASGLNMSVEEMLKLGGTSLEDMLAEFKAQFDEMGLVDSMLKESALEGNFKAGKGKLYLSAGKEYAVDKNVYDTYELDGTTLTLLEHVGSDAGELGGYPMVLVKEG